MHVRSDSLLCIFLFFSLAEPRFRYHTETQSIRWTSFDMFIFIQKPYCYLVHVCLCYIFCLLKTLLVCVLESCFFFFNSKIFLPSSFLGTSYCALWHCLHLLWRTCNSYACLKRKYFWTLFLLYKDIISSLLFFLL